MIPVGVFSSKRLGRKTGGIGNRGKNRDHLDYKIAEIGQNTQKILEMNGDLLSLILQWKTTSKRLMWKIRKDLE